MKDTACSVICWAVWHNNNALKMVARVLPRVLKIQPDQLNTHSFVDADLHAGNNDVL